MSGGACRGSRGLGFAEFPLIIGARGDRHRIFFSAMVGKVFRSNNVLK